MRRKDRQESEEFGREIIKKAEYGVISKGDYSIPISLALEENQLFGHGAKIGEKWQHFKEGDFVRIVFVTDVQVPHPIEKKDLVDLYVKGEKPPLSLSKIFTTNFASAIVTGIFHEINKEEEAKHALKVLCQKYNNKEELLFFEKAFEMSKKVTKVFSIEIKEIQAKHKK